MACPTCRVSWAPDAEEPPCSDPWHEHRRYEMHLHDDAVQLPNGQQVRAASFDADDPYSRTDRPDYGLYLDPDWQPPWPHDHLPWPDFGVPDDPRLLHGALTELLNHVANGDLAEIGCLGGHGRTGTALACAAILTGQKPDTAVTWVRSAYCPAAVETAIQEDFIERSRSCPPADYRPTPSNYDSPPTSQSP